MHQPTVLKTGDKEFLIGMVRSYYSMQKSRVALGNRLVAHFKKKLGMEPAEPGRPLELARMSEEEREKALAKQEKEDSKVIDEVKEKWKLASAGLVNEAGVLLPRMKFDGFFTNKAEVIMMHTFMGMLEQEKKFATSLESVLVDFKVYNDFLVKVPGCGPLMSAVMLAYLDPYKAKYPGAFVKFAGIDVIAVEDQETGEVTYEGRCRKEHHLVMRPYIDKEGKEQVKKGLSFNPDIKTKLVGVLVPGMLKVTSRESHGLTTAEKKKMPLSVKYAGNKYAIMYNQYKTRIANMPAHKEKSDGHRDRMALRHVGRKFLEDFWHAWRVAEGLPVCRTYAEDMLGMTHGEGADGAKGYMAD